MRVKKGISELIGNTPMMELEAIERMFSLEAKILVKIESFNPVGSAKDRVADAMICDAEEKGLLKPGGVIIEPTSGNTGIGLAAIGASKGYEVILTMPETMSKERQSLIKAFGAKIVLTEGAKGMQGSIEKAEELHRNIPGSIIAGQFSNPANPDIHYRTTGREIIEDTEGKVDLFVACVGSGGTISGTGKRLKEEIPGVKVIAVEPKTSAVLSGKPAGAHKIQGIGAGFIPENLDCTVYDEVVAVSDEDAFAIGSLLAKKEGLLVGISSGAAVYASIQLAKRPENKGKVIVAILPDTGERYLSAGMYE